MDWERRQYVYTFFIARHGYWARFLTIGKAIVKSFERLILSIVTLFNIAIPAKHLTVFGNGLAALTPRDNMISVHFLKLKFFSA